MINLNKVVKSLRNEYSRLEKEMGRVGKALDALGHAGGKSLKTTGRTLSKEARKRIASQLPVAEKLKLATETIDCSGSLEETRAQVKALGKKLRSGG